METIKPLIPTKIPKPAIIQFIMILLFETPDSFKLYMIIGII